MGMVGKLLNASNKTETIDPDFLVKKKTGKSEAQIKAIDFFYSDKKIGCGSGSSSVISIDTYLEMVKKKAGSYNVKQMAIDKIGLDESQVKEIDPIVLASFVYDSDAVYKYENKQFVSNKYSITWIFFSLEQIYTYKFIFNMLSDETVEETNDFFYTDITRIGTERKVIEDIRKTTSGCFGGSTYVSSLYVEDEFCITVPGFSYGISMNYSPAIEESVQAAKAMIREKKYSK